MAHAFITFLVTKAFGQPLPENIDYDTTKALHAFLAAKPDSLAFKAYYSLIVTKCSDIDETQWASKYKLESYIDLTENYLCISRMVYDGTGTTDFASHPVWHKLKALVCRAFVGRRRTAPPMGATQPDHECPLGRHAAHRS